MFWAVAAKGSLRVRSGIGERDREEHLPKTRAEIAWVGELSRENNVPRDLRDRAQLPATRFVPPGDRVRQRKRTPRAHSCGPQTSARGIGGLFGLDHRTPFAASAAWRELARLPFAQRVAALDDASMRARLAHLDQPPALDFNQAYILTDDDLDYVHDRDRSLAAYAERTAQSEVEAFIELNRLHRGRVQLWHPGLNQSMEAIEEMITNPTVAMGLADSGAHVGQIMDAQFTDVAAHLLGQEPRRHDVRGSHPRLDQRHGGDFRNTGSRRAARGRLRRHQRHRRRQLGGSTCRSTSTTSPVAPVAMSNGAAATTR